MKKQTVLIGFYRNEAHKLLDRVAMGLAAKEAAVVEAKKWAHLTRSLRGTNKALERKLAKVETLPEGESTRADLDAAVKVAVAAKCVQIWQDVVLTCQVQGPLDGQSLTVPADVLNKIICKETAESVDTDGPVRDTTLPGIPTKETWGKYSKLDLDVAAGLAVKAERAACADMADQCANNADHTIAVGAYVNIRDGIRTRGQK